MQRQTLDHASFGGGQRMNHDEGVCIKALGCGRDSANLQTRDYAEQDVLLSVAETAATFIDRHAAPQVADDCLPDLFAFVRHNCDCRVLFNSMNKKVHRL